MVDCPLSVHSLLKVLGVLILLVLAARLAVVSGKLRADWKMWRKPHWWQTSAWLLAALPLLWCVPPPVMAEPAPETPTPEVLQTLQERLLRAPDCLPDLCASRIHAPQPASGWAANTIAPPRRYAKLPCRYRAAKRVGCRNSVTLDGKPTQALRRDGEQQLWVVVAQGQHDVVLQGALPSRSSIALPLPLKPHRVTWAGEGWQVDGIRDNGIPEDQLQINRTATVEAATGQEMPNLPAFVTLERRLDLGLDWYVTTTVRRVSDSAVPISLAVPLLAGEQPLSEQFTIKDNFINLNLKPQQDTLEWTSRLPQSEQLQLTASDNSAWLEEWHIAASPVWHVEAKGLPINAYSEDASARHIGMETVGQGNPDAGD